MAHNQLKSPRGNVYTLGHELGRGAFGVVHLATRNNNKTVALKSITVNDSAHAQSTCEEAKLGYKLDDPHVLKTFEAWYCNNTIYIVSEYCSQGSLEDFLDANHQDDNLIATKARKWLFQLLQGIAALHEAKFIHRDIKPDNLLIDSEGNIKIGDLGIAAPVSRDANGDNCQYHKTCLGNHGTLLFMAPELFDQNYMRRADIFSIGMVLLAMVQGVIVKKKWGVMLGGSYVGLALLRGEVTVDQLFDNNAWNELGLADLQPVVKLMLNPNKDKRLKAHQLISKFGHLEELQQERAHPPPSRRPPVRPLAQPSQQPAGRAQHQSPQLGTRQPVPVAQPPQEFQPEFSSPTFGPWSPQPSQEFQRAFSSSAFGQWTPAPSSGRAQNQPTQQDARRQPIPVAQPPQEFQHGFSSPPFGPWPLQPSQDFQFGFSSPTFGPWPLQP